MVFVFPKWLLVAGGLCVPAWLQRLIDWNRRSFTAPDICVLQTALAPHTLDNCSPSAQRLSVWYSRATKYLATKESSMWSLTGIVLNNNLCLKCEKMLSSSFLLAIFLVIQYIFCHLCLDFLSFFFSGELKWMIGKKR